MSFGLLFMVDVEYDAYIFNLISGDNQIHV